MTTRKTGSSSIKTEKRKNGKLQDTNIRNKDLTIDIENYDPHACSYLELAVGYTHNLGNFESLRIDVKRGVWCPNTDKHITDAVEDMKNWLSSQMSDLTQEARQQGNDNLIESDVNLNFS